MIAEVAIPISIALDELFDYLVPADLKPPVAAGSRVLVPFRSRTLQGIVLRLKKHSPFEDRIRPIARNLDETPVFDEETFALARKIQSDYFCPFAQALATLLPSGLKAGKQVFQEAPGPAPEPAAIPPLTQQEQTALEAKELGASSVLIHDLSGAGRWTVYAGLIKKTLLNKKSVIFLVPDHDKIGPALERLSLGIAPFLVSSSLSPKKSFENWMGIRKAPFSFVAGTRSAVFAPVHDLGLVIIEEEEHFAYRQDQVPHYRTQDVAFFRAQKAGGRLVLGSFMPSLDSYASASCLMFEREQWPPVRLIDMRPEIRFKAKPVIISKMLEHRMAEAIQNNEKMLIYVNKKGFSTFLYCKKCRSVQSCPRCSGSLTYHFKEKSVSCPTCRYTAAPLDICPACKSSYVKYLGFGQEKVESEILRLFPSARVRTFDPRDTGGEGYDIMLATQQFLEDPRWEERVHDVVAVLGCEQMLGHLDFRSTETAFARLMKLSSVSKKEMVVQTQTVENYALECLGRHDARGFYKKELQLRRELRLPPARPLGLLMVRSNDEKKSGLEAGRIFKRLKKTLPPKKGFELFEPMAAVPFRLRGNYRHQILIKFKTLDSLRRALVSVIEKRRKGVIVTFDPSPL